MEFEDIRIVMSRETNYPENISDAVLALEEEVAGKLVRTVLVEAKNPLCVLPSIFDKCLKLPK